MAISTPYDAQEEKYLESLKEAKDKDEVESLKSQLIKLSAQKWQDETLTNMASEIDDRYTAKQISDADYKQWQDYLSEGGPASMHKYAKQLLTTSDKISYISTAKERIAAIEKAEKEAEENVTDSGGTGATTLSGGASISLTKNDKGQYSIAEQKSSTIANGAVVSSNSSTTSGGQDPTMLDRRPAWIDTNIEYRRRKTDKGFAVDSAIIKRYYSVVDAEVYFGNEYVEDVHDINWIINQQVQPLFGYNSYTYDELARGSRIISGSFTINFTSPNYLFEILKEANKANTVLVENMSSYNVPRLGESVQPVNRSTVFGSRESGHHAAMWPQDFDIDIILGEKTGAGDPVHLIILGCAIQNCQTVLSASAANAPPAIMEQYSFIAQDIRTQVPKSTNNNTVPIIAATDSTSAVNTTNIGNIANINNGTSSSTTTVSPSEQQAERRREANKQNNDKQAIEQAERAKENKTVEEDDEPNSPDDVNQNTLSRAELLVSSAKKGVTSTTTFEQDEYGNPVMVWTYSAQNGTLTQDEIQANAEIAFEEQQKRSNGTELVLEVMGNIARVKQKQ